jgi:hypothetical protein
VLFFFLNYCYICEVSLVVALALLQQCNSTTLLYFLSYATILGDNNVNKRHCCATTMDGRVYGYGLDVCELLRIQESGLEIGRVYLAADSFWLEDLSSYREIVRGAREFILWTMKTFDHRG